jgi:hypothetical protein
MTVTPSVGTAKVIVVPRDDYITCREPAPGTGHCNAAVGLWQHCGACAARKSRRA